MRLAISAVVALTLVGCSSLRPLPIKAGDTCFGCRQVIIEPKLAAEIVDPSGHAFKFRTVECMAKYLANHPDERLEGLFVTDYPSGRFVRAANATYVRSVIDESTMERNYYAFRSASAAAEFAQERTANTADWLAVIQRVSGN